MEPEKFEQINSLYLIVRVIAAVHLRYKAEAYRRSKNGWAFFGFISPIIAFIWLYAIGAKKFTGL